MTAAGTRPVTAAYRERLSPSLWVLVSSAVCAPMAALVFAPFDTTLALVVGAVVGVAIVLALVAVSPVVEVKDGTLTAGRAHIRVDLLGPAQSFVGEEARMARGPGLSAQSWHLIRGGIDGLLVVPVEDADDPVTAWAISSRTPDRLSAAIRSAQGR